MTKVTSIDRYEPILR